MNWYQKDWRFRKKIIISNVSNSNNLGEYQVSLTFDHQALVDAGKAQADGSDLLFTSEDGIVIFPYYIESGINTTSCIIWIRVHQIDALDTIDIYMYYGNSSASAMSSGDDTFEFHDDFPGSSVNTAKWGTGTTGFSVSGGILTGTNTTGRLKAMMFNGLAVTNAYPVIAEAKVYLTTRPTHGAQLLGFYASDSNSIGLLAHPTNDYVRNDSTWTSLVGQKMATGVNYLVRVSIKSTTTVNVFIKNLDTGVTAYDGNFTNTVIADEYLAIGTRYDNLDTEESYDYDWDYIRVRKYTATEPSAGTPGTEENYEDYIRENGQNYGLAISRPEYDVNSCEEENLIYSSKYQSPQPMMCLKGVCGKKAHDIGFPPVFYPGPWIEFDGIDIKVDDNFVIGGSNNYVYLFNIPLNE